MLFAAISGVAILTVAVLGLVALDHTGDNPYRKGVWL
jgi:hypothetical protein